MFIGLCLAGSGYARMEITSPDFKDRGLIPSRFTCEGEDISPGLRIANIPAGTQSLALVVDDLLGQQQVVIKSMETNYKKVDGISGATILGDGTVSLILDITDLIHMAGVHQQSKNGLKLVSSKTRAA